MARHTKNYDYTGGWQRFDVPAGVDWIEVSLVGGGSGDRRAGRVTGWMKVNGKQTLFVLVGQKGQQAVGGNGGGTAVGGGGAGGDGRGHNGGDGGGGASAIRVNSKTGQVRAVAAGAGGNSGDRGLGGLGGGRVGENGWPGNLGDCPPIVVQTEPRRVDYDCVHNATGGTQTQGGNRGTTDSGPRYFGSNADNPVLARGGRGGGGPPNTSGGGGGGGGYHPGGGGQAGHAGFTPGGGGGAGSNYTAGLIRASDDQGEGGTGHGTVSISWISPPPANQPPHIPTDVKVGRKDATGAMATRSTGTVSISAKLQDPDKRYDKDGKPVGPSDTVRLVVHYSPTSDFSKRVRIERGALIGQERQGVKDDPATKKVDETVKARTGRGEVTLRGLDQNTHYYARLYAEDSHGLRSNNYKSIDFWTNRFPAPPDLRMPSENASIHQLSSVVFEWDHKDPDPDSPQHGYHLQWRRARTPLHPASDWDNKQFTTNFESYVANPGTFRPNSFYEWRVRTQDPQGKWGEWSLPRSFFITGETAPPIGRDPIKGEARDVTRALTFKWDFRDPNQGDEQVKADLRYRPEGTGTWFNLFGDTFEPGGVESWSIPADTFMPGTKYEWQVRTQDSLNGAVSDWSDTEKFWATSTPGVGEGHRFISTQSEALTSLGCGMNRVFVYDRGGRIPRGEITPLTNLTWSRQRDDIGNCVIDTNGFDWDCGRLLASLRSWMHELVVFRDGERVWEGPITRITYQPNFVEVEAKDVMAYLYRRIMRQGYNDAYRVVNGEQLGMATVVERATRIAMNALAPDDPNVLRYLTSMNFPDDALQSRSRADYSTTAWEEIDDLAATGGLDYSTVGRRIIFNDTHRALGRLPEMRDEHFSDAPVVTEYGMQTATVFAVTNNNGVYGEATRAIKEYGLVEQLASAYGETEGGQKTTLTAEARANLERTLREQAQRNISGRYPTPLIVRVPDNSALNPETPVTINQLVPGVWVPLRAQGTVREVAQWQKLDLMTVEQTAEGERVTVTMSPAPNGGADPDSGEGVDAETVQ